MSSPSTEILAKDNVPAIASIGLRSKTARAIVVVLSGTADNPTAVRRTDLVFATIKQPALFQPYHEVLDLPRSEAQPGIDRAKQELEKIALRELQQLINTLESEGFDVRCAGVVGAPERDIDRLGSPHIRAHAGEGLLFRRILDSAAKNASLRLRTVSERDIFEIAPQQLGVSPTGVQKKLAVFGNDLGRPWRADEKAAAIAAWIALTAIPDR